MREIVYHVATSLDFFICHADGSVHSFIEEGEHIPDYLDSLKNYDTVIMGRATYEFGYRFGLRPGALPYPHMRHYVFSKTLKFSELTQIHVVSHDELDVLRALKSESGTPIYLCGGGTFASFLLRHQLIDRLIVKLNPVIFGKGVRMFEGFDQPLGIDLIDSRGYDSGVMLLTYRLQYEKEIKNSW